MYALKTRGGTIYANERRDRAIQLSSRSGVRVYSVRGKRIGPVFSSVEKEQDYLNRREANALACLLACANRQGEVVRP